MTSLVERASRFAIFLRNNDRQSRPVMNGLVQALQALPHLARRCITFNRGTKLTDWPYLQASIGPKPDSAIHNRHGTKARSKIPTDEPVNGFRERSIRSPSEMPTLSRSAIGSRPHHASAWDSYLEPALDGTRTARPDVGRRNSTGIVGRRHLRKQAGHCVRD